MSTSAHPNYYEILQLSPNAEQVVITKIYRLLAAYYHPDNKQTGNEERFKLVLESYEVLSDPAKRSRYNLEIFGSSGKTGKFSPHNGLNSKVSSIQEILGSRSTTFESAVQAADNQISERAIRKLILFALYDVRRNTPDNPEISLLVLSELLGCTVNELEFSTWYLKEKGLIKVTESADFSITVAGVDYVEREYLEPDSKKYPLSLPAPHN